VIARLAAALRVALPFVALAGADPAHAASVARGAGPPTLAPGDAPRAVARYGRFEASVVLSPVPENPFDPGQADVWAVFVDPRGREHRANAFWYQAHERALVGDSRGFAEVLTPTGSPHFRVRFTPAEAGAWRWWWEASSPDGRARTDARRLEVRPSRAPGFLRRSERDSRYLAFDDGSSYFAVGENLAWYDARGTHAYDAWLDRLAAQGATYIRLWMPSWAMGIEWSDGPLGDYSQRLDRAWQLDYVLEAAAARGMQVMLSLQNHGAFSTEHNSEWAANPYNAANGGPLAAPEEFLTDATARNFFKRRLRYVVARWGYSTALLAWELFNEADLVDGYHGGNDTLEWHREMAQHLRSLDPHDHLVTTSFAVFLFDPRVWRQAGLDLTQLHFYSVTGTTTLAPNLAQDVSGFTAGRLEVAPVPVLFAELGVDARGPAETMASDPEGIGVHDGLFAGVVSGGFGTAMPWWWDNVIDVEPDRYYPMFGAVARWIDGVRFDRERFAALEGAAESAARPLVAYGLTGKRHALVWVKDDAFQWNAPNAVRIEDGTLRFDALAPGRWCGDWYDTWAGRSTDRVRVNARRGRPVAVAIPAFERDVALRLKRCEGANVP
jgi:hypothetical protein